MNESHFTNPHCLLSSLFTVKEPDYPDTINKFTEGIKGDMFEMFNSIHKSFKMLFPVVARDDDEDDEEVEAVGEEDGPAPKKKARRSSIENVVNDIRDAVKSRCPSTWTEKENVKLTVNGTIESSSLHKRTNHYLSSLTSHGHNPYTDRKIATPDP